MGWVMSLNLKIPNGPFAAHIYDLDGTLANTMPLHLLAWQHAFKKYGASFTFDAKLFMTVAGMGHSDTIHLMNSRYGDQLDPGAVTAEKERYFVSHMEQIEPIGEVVQIAQKAYADGLPLAIASGGPTEIVIRTLEILGIRPLFSALACQCDVTRSKPAPDIFLCAANRLGVDPNACLVFEDSLLGIEGAHVAGMQTVQIPSMI
jgi:HAD superfamily hydrolase (TIGR01509 family)